MGDVVTEIAEGVHVIETGRERDRDRDRRECNT